MSVMKPDIPVEHVQLIIVFPVDDPVPFPEHPLTHGDLGLARVPADWRFPGSPGSGSPCQESLWSWEKGSGFPFDAAVISGESIP